MRTTSPTGRRHSRLPLAALVATAAAAVALTLSGVHAAQGHPEGEPPSSVA